MKASSEEFMGKLSRLKGPNKDLQAAALLLGNAAVRVDRKTLNRSTKLAHRFLVNLKRALPETDPKVIGDFVAEVSDLWDYGQKLDRTLADLCTMRLPMHQEQMREALVAMKCNNLIMRSIASVAFKRPCLKSSGL